MFKHTKKILASLFILAGITLFISCQDEPTLVTPDAQRIFKGLSFTMPPEIFSKEVILRFILEY
jgi:hypothetical protein